MAWNNDDYVQVNERIEAFYAKFPDGSLQSEIVEMTDSRVTVKAYAYRDRDDTKPAVGHSYLGIPGSTNFTKGSELENAETSAWGRALAALGFEVKRGIASKQEVENKQTPRSPQTPKPAPKKTSTVGDLMVWAMKEFKLEPKAVLEIYGVKTQAEITDLKLAADKVKAYAAGKDVPSA